MWFYGECGGVPSALGLVLHEMLTCRKLDPNEMKLEQLQ